MAITFTINITRDPNSLLDVEVQITSEANVLLLTEGGFQIIAG